MNPKQRLLSFYDIFPFESHPLWAAITRGELSLAAVLRAEIQHYLRTKAGQPLRLEALQNVETKSPHIFEMLLETYLEECTAENSHPSHLEMIERLLVQGGVRHSELQTARPTVGNALAIAMYRDISRRGAGCHMLGAGAVEFFYSRLSPKVFRAYTDVYGMSTEQAETYEIHGSMDQEHADRAFSVLPEAIALHGWPDIEASVRDAFAATSLHYDGMLEAATGIVGFWNGGRI